MANPSAEHHPIIDREWVCRAELGRLVAENQRDLHEQYFNDVAGFREVFFDKLQQSCEASYARGWAIFHAEEEAGNVATIPAREVLILGKMRPDLGVRLHGETPMPLIRMITNEPVITEDGFNYLTEDVAIFENGRTRYMMSAVETDRNGQLSGGGLVKFLERSSSPLFMVNRMGRLVLTLNASEITPEHLVAEEVGGAILRAAPFGYKSFKLEDSVYALGKAEEILFSVLGTDPSHWYRRAHER